MMYIKIIKRFLYDIDDDYDLIIFKWRVRLMFVIKEGKVIVGDMV